MGKIQLCSDGAKGLPGREGKLRQELTCILGDRTLFACTAMRLGMCLAQRHVLPQFPLLNMCP